MKGKESFMVIARLKAVGVQPYEGQAQSLSCFLQLENKLRPTVSVVSILLSAPQSSYFSLC